MILDGNSRAGNAKVYSSRREMVLEKKYEKLKALILLTDKSISNEHVTELAVKQWNEFIRCFPDEGEK